MANQSIDIGKIEDACREIDTAANDYIACANEISRAAEICNASALSVNGQTMQPSLEELATKVKKYKQSVTTFTTETIKLAKTVQKAPQNPSQNNNQGNI